MSGAGERLSSVEEARAAILAANELDLASASQHGLGPALLALRDELGALACLEFIQLGQQPVDPLGALVLD